jgi:hypothetical protein
LIYPLLSTSFLTLHGNKDRGEMQPSREYMALATTLLDAIGDEKDGEDFM